MLKLILKVLSNLIPTPAHHIGDREMWERIEFQKMNVRQKLEGRLV